MEMENEIDTDIGMGHQMEETGDQAIYHEEEDGLNRTDNDDLLDANGEILEDYE